MPQTRNEIVFAHLMHKEFWFLASIGGAYGYYHTKPWAVMSSLNYFLMATVLTVTMLFLAYTNYLVMDNISLVSQSSHIFVCGVVAITAIATTSYERKKIADFHDFFVNPYICEYSRNDYFEGLKVVTQKKKKYYVIVFTAVYGACGVVGLLQPIIDWLLDRSFEKSLPNGVYLNLPLTMWSPIDLDNFASAWVFMYWLQSSFVLYMAIMVSSAVILCFTIMDRILDQLKLLIYGVNQLDARSKDLFKQRYPGSDFRCMTDEYDECYRECVLQNVKHHHLIKNLVKYFLDIAHIPLAVPFFGGAVLLGMAAITLTAEDDPRVGPKCLAACLAISEAYNMYLLSYVGQRFQDLSGELYNALYFTKWYKRSVETRKAIMLMRLGSYEPMKMVAAKMLILNMKLFGDLVNSAYSIFNLKAASKTANG
ncbi:Odorant receptor [Nesidiocoris tenuis]|uniref:Odorant receptor n=1 Tax=Nesidiocoris tenuis TaxID=355587 RepID=A0ABN7ARA0_9HEMI|nr:Odorant receptor [Nesidiocoris tenuis]